MGSLRAFQMISAVRLALASGLQFQQQLPCISPKRTSLLFNITHTSEEMTPILTLAWIIVLVHLQVSLILYVFLKQTSRELDRPNVCPPFKGEHLDQAQTRWLSPHLPQGQAPRFSHGWLKISSLLRYSRYDWVDHRMVECTRNQVLGKSPIRALFWR